MRFLKRFLRSRPRPATPSLVPVQLRADELESRLTPSSSNNWSGYAVSAATGAVTAVNGEWTVPTVTGAGTKYSAVWVGIDGYNSNSVEQTGIAADTVNGVPQYYAWYEMYPNASVAVNLAIHPGDTISASVTYSASTGQFTLSLKDLSDPAGSNSFSINKSGPTFQRSSAEWIVEAPSSNTGILPLANFGSVTFTNATATINGTTGPINNSTWASSVTPINMVSATTGATEATTEALNSTGAGFTVFFGVPSPPTSPPPAPPVSPPPPASPPPPVSPPPAPSSTSTVTTLTAGKVTYYGSYALETLTVTVKPTSGTTLPTGTIDLIYGGRVIGTATLKLVNGVETATFQIEYIANGNYTFTADYLGGSGFQSSSSSTTVRV